MTEAMIQANRIAFTYPGASEKSLRDISFSAYEGEAVAVVGGAGAGKSSLLKVLAGFVPTLVKGQREGELLISGNDPAYLPAGERVKSAGLLFSEPSCQLSGICATVVEEVAWGLGNLGVPREEMEKRVNAVLRRMRLTELRDRSPYVLSSGQQQRVALASILALAPKCVFLDEPVTALDPLGRHEVLQAALDLAHEGHIVFWTTTHLEEAASFPRWIVLDRGCVAYDGPQKIPKLSGNSPLEAPWTRIERELTANHLLNEEEPEKICWTVTERELSAKLRSVVY